MKETPLHIQIYYELALSVGNSADLSTMLKRSLSTYMRKLNCLAGIVLQIQPAAPTAFQFSKIFSLPKRIDHNTEIQQALKYIPTHFSQSELTSYLNQLPVSTETAGGLHVHSMPLSDFGLLLLAKSGEPLPITVLKSLQPINQKLANACHGCIQNEKVEKLVVQLQDEARERLRTQDQLTLSTERYQAIFENIQDVYYECLPEGTILEISPSVERVLGYPREELLGKSMSDLYVTKEERLKAVAAIVEKGHVSDHEVRLIAKNGHQVYGSFNAVLDRAGDPDNSVIIGSIRDITKRKSAENALETAKNNALSAATELEKANRELSKLNRAVEQSPTTVIITDYEGRIEYVNPAFCRTTGYTSEEVIGRNPRFLKSGLLEKSVHEDLWNTILAGKVWEGEFHNRTKDGTLFWEHAFISPVTDSTGAVTHFISLKEDITWRKNAEAEMVEARKKIDAADAARSQFLANMSHEIRTPLNAVIGTTSLLLNTGLDSEQMEMANTVRISADSLMTAMNNILDYAKIMADQLLLDASEFDLEVLMEDVMASLQPQAEEKHIGLNTAIAPDLPLQLIGDSVRLKQVLANLISNGIKFTESGEVAVSIDKAAEDDETAGFRITVSDTGIGIDQDYLPHLFECFSQQDNSLSRRYSGTGMGLAVSKYLVEAMDGAIGVESPAGEGTTFWFTVQLPKKPNGRRSEAVFTEREAVHAGAPASEEADADRSAMRILVAEDNHINQKITLKILETLGYQAEAVDNGRKAVEATHARSYDLILMDIQMPEMDGLEATRAIRRDNAIGNRKIPIVALTAHAMNWDREICIEAGMNDYLAKPVDPDQLDAVIASHLAAS